MSKNIKPLISAIIFMIIMTVALLSCNKTDNNPPIITLIGEDSISVVLNSEYVDQGAKVVDETEGDISSKLFVDNTVNTDLVGEYIITYKAIDNAGNEAAPVYRYVSVFNSAKVYGGNYQVTESEFYPGNDMCSYPVIVAIDSTVNFRIDFQDFACGLGFRIKADVKNGALIIPYQEVSDTLQTMTIQGQGSISDTLIYIEYYKEIDSVSSYWNATYIK